MAQQNQSDQKMHDTLQRTVRHVVETMCFSEVAATDETWQNADTIVTAVNFYGSRSGRLQLEVSSSAAWSLRDSFLGKPEQGQAAADSAGEVVAELGTMICGRFLSSVDPLSPLSLATPETSQCSVSVLRDAPRNVRQGFLLQAGHLTASVQFDSEKSV